MRLAFSLVALCASTAALLVATGKTMPEGAAIAAPFVHPLPEKVHFFLRHGEGPNHYARRNCLAFKGCNASKIL